MGERQTVFSLVWKTLKVSINVFENLNCTHQHFNSKILLKVASNCNFVHFVIILDFAASFTFLTPSLTNMLAILTISSEKKMYNEWL